MPSTSALLGAPVTATVPVTERLVFVPRDRKCPMFRGRSGIALSEWLEEVQTCMRAHRLSTSDQAFFLFDHLQGEARVLCNPAGGFFSRKQQGEFSIALMSLMEKVKQRVPSDMPNPEALLRDQFVKRVLDSAFRHG